MYRVVFTIAIQKPYFFSIGNGRIDKASIKAVLDKLDYHQAKELFKELYLCIAESKWMVCHKFFRECLYDKSAKSFRYFPPCQETCDLYIRRTKSCRKVVGQFLKWNQEAKNVLFKDTFFSNCSFYPKKSSGNCQDIPLSKQLYFVEGWKFLCVFLLSKTFFFSMKFVWCFYKTV